MLVIFEPKFLRMAMAMVHTEETHDETNGEIQDGTHHETQGETQDGIHDATRDEKRNESDEGFSRA